MIRKLPGAIRGALAFFLVGANTVFSCLTLYVFAVPKFLGFTKFSNRALSKIAETWVRVNGWITDLTQTIRWDVKMDFALDPKRSYLILSNHQSWVDIVVLQRILNKKIPLPRFFIKKQLFWVPFLGPAWWALDFPFMNRYSKEYLQKHPEKRLKDLETTKRRCERFREFPTAILIFAEGTRFSEKKRVAKASPFRHLLPPKAGGLSAVMEVMGEQFSDILDITIAYPDTPQTFWGLLSGKVRDVKVWVSRVPVENFKTGNFEHMKEELDAIWSRKDRLLKEVAAHV